jgi:hypothetical protein
MGRWSSVLVSFLSLASPSALFAQQASSARGIGFTRQLEPNERAFSILVPTGWTMRGGIFRVNAMQAGGPLNAQEAKCDLLFTSDARGSVSFHILPDVVYAHVGIGGGFFPPGSSYQGATVRPFQSADAYLRDLVAYLHPKAQNLTFAEVRRLPGEIQAMDRGMAYLNSLLGQLGGAQMTFKSDAAGATVEYVEDGVRYREVLLAGIVDMRAAQTWKNTRTLAFRAPAAEWERWRAVMDVMRFSLRFNQDWVLKESQGQRERADIALKVFQEMNRIDAEIARRTRVNHEEIMNDDFLVLTGQEEYVNPHTNEIETDTNEFKYRWETAGGDRYYTNREDEDPNVFLKRGDYKRTPVRPRKNQ